MPTPFREIRLHGNRINPFPEGVQGPTRSMFRGDNLIVCRDGYMFSVIAGYCVYSIPRPGMEGVYPVGVGDNYEGPYTHVEVGVRGPRIPKPVKVWKPYWEGVIRKGHTFTITVFPYVPIGLVYDLIKLHRGQADYVPGWGWPYGNPERDAMHRKRGLARMRGFTRKFDEASPVGEPTV